MKYRYFIAYGYFLGIHSGIGNSIIIHDKKIEDMSFNEFCELQNEISEKEIIPKLSEKLRSGKVEVIITNFKFLNYIRAEGFSESNNNNHSQAPEPR